MRWQKSIGIIVVAVLAQAHGASITGSEKDKKLHLSWKDDFLTIAGPDLPGRELKVHYLEAYCRPGSTNRRWQDTLIGHQTRLIEADPNGQCLRLQCVLEDGVVVDHQITASSDEVDFRLTARNPKNKTSEVNWAQPCIRLDAFTGRDKDSYLNKCFIFLGGKLTRMPTPHWATKALYTPGQVWCPRNINRADVNPRPLSDDVPDCGLIGCYSADEKTILAVAFEPYQELFQGVACCLHSDFRIRGLKPGETKKIRGKIYIVPANVEALLERYRGDFPEQAANRAHP